MTPKNYTSAYKATDITTANRVKLVVMLYEGAIRFLQEAKKRIENKDIPGRSVALSKALRIVNELHGSLNIKDGGEIAEQLDRLYRFLITHISRANMTGDVVFLDESLKVLENLREGWNQIEKAPETKQAIADEASPKPPQRFVAHL